MKAQTLWTMLVLALVGLALAMNGATAMAQSGGTYDLTWNSIDSGGGPVSGGRVHARWHHRPGGRREPIGWQLYLEWRVLVRRDECAIGSIGVSAIGVEVARSFTLSKNSQERLIMTRRVLLVFGMVSALLLGVINFVYAQDAGPHDVAGPQAVDATDREGSSAWPLRIGGS